MRHIRQNLSDPSSKEFPIDLLPQSLGILKKKGIGVVGMLMIGVLLLMFCPQDTTAQNSYEGYYLYLGENPSGREISWGNEAQGLTHDNDNWFITQNDELLILKLPMLWKIPVEQDLNNIDPPGTNGVERVSPLAEPDLVDAGYDHFGDLSYYAFEGQGYLLIAVERGSDIGGVAAYKADTLRCVGHRTFAQNIQTRAPWCAIDPQGKAYTSNDNNVTSVNKFVVDWSALKNGQGLIFSDPTSVFLFDENGFSLTLNHLQGGVISPSGELLYIVADGIHVFDLSTGRRVRKSTNGGMPFGYEFHPGWPDYEEPEGITIWPLDDGKAPEISGTLHVFMLDNDGIDDIYLKHYTETINVDLNYTGEEQGRLWDPFNTVGEANTLAWDGARISIKAGSYPETLTFSKRIEVVPDGGMVTIGE